MELPRDYRYSRDHCWVHVVGESARVGVCPRGIDARGIDLEVSLPSLGAGVRVGEVLAEITIDGTCRSVPSPVSGSVVLVNDRLIDDPRLVAADPFGSGWLCEMQLSYDETLEGVVDVDSYARLLG